MGVFNQEQKQNIRNRYGDTAVWDFIHAAITRVLDDELIHLRVTNQGIFYEVFRITDFVMGDHAHEEKVSFCSQAFEVENERVNEYGNETAERSEIQFTTYLIVHLASALLCSRVENDSYALEILNSCHSLVSSKIREKVRDGVASILEEKENNVGKQLQCFMRMYGLDGKWISCEIDNMIRAKKEGAGKSGNDEASGAGMPPRFVVNGNVTYIENNNAPVVSGVNSFTSDNLSALQGLMKGEKDQQPSQDLLMDTPSYPESNLDAVLFNEALDMPKIKQVLGELVEKKRGKDELNIAHWFVVWKVFREYNFIKHQNTQAKFIQWVKAVFGWSWQTQVFKGSTVPDGIRNIPLDEWTIENLSAQRPQAEEYIGWRDDLLQAFLIAGGNGRMDCKEELCNRWFDTRLG